MYTEINPFEPIDEGIQRYMERGGDIEKALQVIDGLIEKNRTTPLGNALIYARGKLQTLREG